MRSRAVTERHARSFFTRRQDARHFHGRFGRLVRIAAAFALGRHCRPRAGRSEQCISGRAMDALACTKAKSSFTGRNVVRSSIGVSSRMRMGVTSVIRKLGVKMLAATLFAALVVGWFAWLVLPVAPRMSILTNRQVTLVTWSPDCQYVACAEGNAVSRTKREGELKVWDTREGRELFSIPYNQTFPDHADGGYSFAFTPGADKLVLYSWGD